MRRVDLRAILGNTKGKKVVYVNPTVGRASNHKISADDLPIDRSTWWGKRKDEKTLSSPIFYFSEVRDEIRFHAVEMARFFPDFQLYEDDQGFVFWKGKIDGVGEVKVSYPLTYPSVKFKVELLDQEESFNEELQRLIYYYDGITPAGAIIVAMRFFLLKKVACKA